MRRGASECISPSILFEEVTRTPLKHFPDIRASQLRVIISRTPPDILQLFGSLPRSRNKPLVIFITLRIDLTILPKNPIADKGEDLESLSRLMALAYAQITAATLEYLAVVTYDIGVAFRADDTPHKFGRDNKLSVQDINIRWQSTNVNAELNSSWRQDPILASVGILPDN